MNKRLPNFCGGLTLMVILQMGTTFLLFAYQDLG
jgi:hypothetical protein